MDHHAGGRRRWRGGALVITGVLAVGLLAAGGLCLAAVPVVAGEVDDARADAALAIGPLVPDELVESLQNERDYSSTYLLGFDDALRLPVASVEEATAATDEALATLRAETERSGGAAADAVGAVLGGIEGPLAELRRNVSEFTGERGISRTDVSEPLYEGYTDLVDGLLDAGRDMASGIADKDIRQGARLLDLAVEQEAESERIVRTLLIAGVSPGGLDTPDEIAALSRGYGRLVATQEQLAALAVGEYGGMADRFASGGSFDDFTSMLDQSIADPTVPVVDVVDMPSAGGLAQDYDAFRHDVASRIESLVDHRLDEAESRERLFLGLALAAGAAFVAVAAVGITLAVSRR